MQTIVVEREAGVVTATLARPERRNAIDMRMFRELRALCEEVSADRAARVLVLRGAGGDFSSGADLGAEGTPGDQSIGASTAAYLRNEVTPSILALHRLSKPTLAAVEGVCAGAGANVALGCDLVIAAEGARFSQIFIRRALSLDCGGSWLLPRIVGLRRAKELAFFGDWVDARDAERIGLVSRVVPAAEVGERTREWALRLAEQPPLALSLSKAALDRSFSLSMAEALEEEAVSQGLAVGARDFSEAMKAFAEKRPPRFTGG